MFQYPLRVFIILRCFCLLLFSSPPTENIRDAKHGWLMATHNALCHGHAFKCQLGYCDRWCLEGPRTWGVLGLGHVKTDGQTDILSSWQYDKDSPAPALRHPWVQQQGRAHPPIFLPTVQSHCCASHEVHSRKLGRVGRAVTHRLPSNRTALIVWQQTLRLTLWWKTPHGACRDCSTRQTAIRFN